MSDVVIDIEYERGGEGSDVRDSTTRVYQFENPMTINESEHDVSEIITIFFITI